MQYPDTQVLEKKFLSEKQREQFLKELDDLKQIIELPTLYLANYFSDLRNQVDLEINTQKMLLQNDDKEKQNLNKIWEEMISKIYSFERQYTNKKFEFGYNNEKINAIEDRVKHNEFDGLSEISETIQREENELLKKIFANKTIVFFNVKKEEKKYKLIVLNEFINPKEFKKR